jgi:carbamoyltransferase
MRILGISPYHDASVCVVEDGKVKYFSKQERLTKIKRDSLKENNLTVLNYVLDNFKDKPIDKVVICSPTPNSFFVEWLQTYLLKKIKNNCEIIKYCTHHHLAHASLSFYNSGFKKALCLVIDRNGALIEDKIRESESLFVAEYPCEFIPIYKNYYLKNKGEKYDVENHKLISQLKKENKNCEIYGDSTLNITKVYESATTLIGQNILENGKTMGLSAYGKDKPFNNLFVNHQPNDNLFFHYIESEVGYKDYIYNQVKEVPKNKTLYADYAFQVQKQTQEEVLYLVKKYTKKTDIKNVCLSGGYALNVVTNEFLIKNLPNINFYFELLADDSGNSIGAALHLYRKITKDKKINKLNNIFFNHKKDNFKIKGQKSSISKIAKLLSEQKIIAVYNEQAEAGPRALGNRSILFDARNKKAKEIVNKIKKREWYRPFACSVLEEYARDYFNMYHLKNSPFMTISFPVLKNKLKIIPGVIHVDNSCRIQTVNKSIPHLYKLLTEFKKITNVPVLLNTSFNIAGNPLVESKEDAIKTFKESDIDVLWFPELGKIITKC